MGIDSVNSFTVVASNNISYAVHSLSTENIENTSLNLSKQYKIGNN